jgi:hypothetical protein
MKTPIIAIIVVITTTAFISQSAPAQSPSTLEEVTVVEKVKEFTPYEATLVKKILLRGEARMSKDEYLEFRKWWIELMVSNRNRTARMLKSCLLYMPIGKLKPEMKHVWDVSPDLNLAIMFRICARANGIQLPETEVSDFDAKLAGVSSLLKSKEEVSFLVEIRDLFD